MNENVTTVLDTVRELTRHRLANMVADIGGPDADDSPGAVFLSHVRDAVIEALEWKVENGDGDLAHAAVVLRDDSHELADAAVPVYTYQRWTTFVDLAAWQIDISEYSAGEDMTDRCGVALYEVARLLVDELCQHVETTWFELDDDGEGDVTDDEQDDAADEELDGDSGE